MNLDKIIEELKKNLSPRRFHHTEGVAHTAKKLALRYGADPEKAYIAGWIHDCAKEMTLSEMQEWTEKKGMHLDSYMMGSRALLHGPAGSAYGELHFHITDEEILRAVVYHTTGRPHMTLLEKIVFLADYIEPSRDFPGVDKLRKLAEKDLDEAMLAAYDSTIRHLLDQEAYIYDLTFLGRNELALAKEARKHNG